MPFVRRGSGYRRGMGAAQANPCACQYPLPGVTPIPGIPNCDPNSGLAPGCSAAQQAVPFCSGIPYGQPGYTQCLSATQQTYKSSNPVAGAALATFIPTVAPTPAAPSNTAVIPGPSAPAQSNAPNPTPVGSSSPSQTTAQSNAPNTTYATPVAATSAGCFTLFGNEPCLGPVGLYTLLAGAGGLFLAFSFFGKHR